ncbi:hypothetical protein Tco_0137820 [Tanacetum coccineum]
MKAPIVFSAVSSEDALDEPLIIEAVMEGYLVCRIYVDQGASVKVMFEHCFENLSPKIKSRLRSTQTDLVGFVGDVVKPLGNIELEVVFGLGFLAPRGIAMMVTRTVIISECRRIEKKQMVEKETHRDTPLAKVKSEDSLTKEILVNPSYPKQLEPSDMTVDPSGGKGSIGVAESRYSSVGEIFHVDIHSGTGKKVRRKLEDVHRLPKH